MFAPDLEDDFADRDVSLTSGNHSLDTVHFRLALRSSLDDKGCLSLRRREDDRTFAHSLTLALNKGGDRRHAVTIFSRYLRRFHSSPITTRHSSVLRFSYTHNDGLEPSGRVTVSVIHRTNVSSFGREGFPPSVHRKGH